MVIDKNHSTVNKKFQRNFSNINILADYELALTMALNCMRNKNFCGRDTKIRKKN